MRLLFALMAALLAATPVVAADDQSCAEPAMRVERQAAAHAESDAARKALYLSRTATQLCEAGNAREARKKFRQALTILGDEPSVQTVQR